MKKIFFIIGLMIIFSILSANPVSEHQANQIAREFLSLYSKENFKIDSTEPIKASKNVVAFIYQLKPDGFIAVSADDDVYPIIAYSFHNQLIFDSENLIYQMIKTDITRRIIYTDPKIKANNKNFWNNFSILKDRDYFQQWPAPNTTSTGGWVETKWHQSGIYNAFCPLDSNGQRSVVGCVATAMAMIIDFHKYIGNAHFTNSDDYWSGYSNYFRIDDTHQERDYPSFPELNNYLDELRSHLQNDEPLTNQDKAALSFACGVSVQMNYSSEGSGSQVYKAASAFRNKFGFVSASYIDNYGSSFYNTLKSNMKSMKPAELGIFTAGYNNGHAIICDGYNTDNYYHLNFGWGSSDNSCWYLLPNGMPYDYSIVDGAAVNIEGGDIPVAVNGHVNIENNASEGIYITLDGPRFYESYILDNSCNFLIPAVQTGTYIATAIKDGRTYYDSKIVEITQSNHYITFDMGNYEALTGIVTAPINPVGTIIDIYQNNEIIFSTTCENENGTFSIPDVLPGTYIATASLEDRYFDQKEFELTLENQTVNFNLEEYSGNFSVGYHNSAEVKWSLMANYTISCGIKLTNDEIEEHPNHPVAQITFKAPLSSDQCEIFVQLWEENNLLAEHEVTNFEEGEWVTQSLGRFIILNPEKEYFAAYKINAQTPELAYADMGPRVLDKGAFFRTSSWTQIPQTVLDRNFCIEAVFISQEYSSISGTITTNDNYSHLENTVISTQNGYITHSDSNGNYTLYLPGGTYDVTAYLIQHISQTVNSITVDNSSAIDGIDFELAYTASADENNITNENIKVRTYPNPFYYNSKKSQLTFELSKKTESTNAIISIYNLKGEKICSISPNSQTKVVWNLKNSNNKLVSNGIYFYKLIDGNNILQTGKFIVIK